MSDLRADDILRMILERALAQQSKGTFCEGDTCTDPLCGFHATAHLRRMLDDISSVLPVGLPAAVSGPQLARMIDHTLLKPEASAVDVEKLCREARIHRFAAVCVNPAFLPEVVAMLRGSEVRPCTVVGFPLGTTTTQSKAHEAEEAARSGARELDMVINIGMMRSGRLRLLYEDILAVTQAAHRHNALCKVILENALLTNEEKVRACLLAQRAGADFVKTSTGFSTSGASAPDVRLMRLTVGPSMGVKAAGGIRTREEALTMIAHGASRIGTSSSVAIVSTAAPAQTGAS